MKHRKLPLEIAAYLLALACLMSLFTACVKQTGDKTTEEVTDGTDEYPDDLGAFDFGNEKFKLVDAVDMLNQTGDVNRIPFLNVSSYGMSSQKFALILHTLEKNGIAEKRTDLKTRTVWYRIR